MKKVALLLSMGLFLTSLALASDRQEAWFKTWDRPEYREWAKPIDQGYLLHIIRKLEDTFFVAQAVLVMGDQNMPGFEIIDQHLILEEENALKQLEQWRAALSDQPKDEL